MAMSVGRLDVHWICPLAAIGNCPEAAKDDHVVWRTGERAAPDPPIRHHRRPASHPATIKGRNFSPAHNEAITLVAGTIGGYRRAKAIAETT